MMPIAKYLKSFNETLKIHQIKGKISRCPLGLLQGTEKLIMKSLSCCEEECQHFNLGVINYQKTKLRFEDVYRLRRRNLASRFFRG